MMAGELLAKAKRIQALAQTGRTYCRDPYDLERYAELERISFELMQAATDAPMERIAGVFGAEVGYPTPKMDVRASIIVDGRILLIRETTDGRWSLPGGWADVDFSVREMVVKESREEAGLEVIPGMIIAVLERNRYNPPPLAYGCIKIFVDCAIASATASGGKGGDGNVCAVLGFDDERGYRTGLDRTGGDGDDVDAGGLARRVESGFVANFETDGIGFFPRGALPPLSETRVTAAQIDLCFRAHGDPGWKTFFD